MGVRIVRMIPLLIFLAVLAAGVYLYVSYRQSPLRAKEVLIKMFLWVTGILTAFFGLATLYAVFESNTPVFDLAFSFMLATALGLAVTLFCRWRFLKHHPLYKFKAADTKTMPREPAWLTALKKLLQMYMGGRR